MTNLIILSISLVTNQQQAVVGESNGKALIASQETIVQRVDLGYMKGARPISIGEFSRIIGQPRLTTNAIAFAFPPKPVATEIQNAPTNKPLASPQPPARTENTNSPAFKRKQELLKQTTNAPPQQTK
jgi:hypothetical protein